MRHWWTLLWICERQTVWSNFISLKNIYINLFFHLSHSVSICVYRMRSEVVVFWLCDQYLIAVNTAFERRHLNHLYKKRERASERANESERKRENISTKESQESDFKNIFNVNLFVRKIESVRINYELFASTFYFFLNVSNFIF